MNKNIKKLEELLLLFNQYKNNTFGLSDLDKPIHVGSVLGKPQFDNLKSLNRRIVMLYAELEEIITEYSQYKNNHVYNQYKGDMGNIYQVAFSNNELLLISSSLDNVISDLRFIISKLKSMPKDKIKTGNNFDNFRSLIHPDITKIAKSRFESMHYADAVEASLKEINTIIKKIYKNKTGKDDDGSSLMKNVFSPNNPVIELGDLTTESGKNIQLGFMEIFAGSMTGIRNPKAHSNMVLTKEECIHLLFLASLLRSKLGE